MRFCWASYALWAVIALFGLSALAAGCGAKGPLYLPEKKQPETTAPVQQDTPTDLPTPPTPKTEP